MGGGVGRGDFCFFKVTQPLTVSTVLTIDCTVKEKGGKYPLPYGLRIRNPFRNLIEIVRS
jgi:hypothetical protein